MQYTWVGLLLSLPIWFCVDLCLPLPTALLLCRKQGSNSQP